MDVKEARAVYWLRVHHHPMGELLDAGYLNESRLAWAAENAYDPQIKQASAVLLDWVRRQVADAAPQPPSAPPELTLPAIEAGITPEQARKTVWPFQPFKGQPMGVLVDTRQLSLKDLAYAVENAWDARVRRAAIVLLAERLSQEVREPTPPVGPLKVVTAGKSYSESEELRWTFLSGVFSGAVLLLWLGLLVYAIGKVAKGAASMPPLPATPEEVIALVIALVIVIGTGLGIGEFIKYLHNSAEQKIKTELENAQKGQEGEDAVIEALRQNLDGTWTLFRNLTLPGKNRADMDAVIVGPSGVWVLEIKNYTGAYRNFGEHWEVQAGKRPKPLKKSPSRQAQNNAVWLSGFLKADGIQQYVDKAVIWANRESRLTVDHPAVPVWTLETLPEELGNLWRSRSLVDAVQARIIAKLTDLCEKTGHRDTAD